MVACDRPLENLQLMFQRNLAEEVADAEGHRAHENRFAVPRDPDAVSLEVRFGVRSDSVVSHATILAHPVLRLKARVFDHPRFGE